MNRAPRKPTPHRTAPLVIIAALTVTLAMGACARRLNDRHTIGAQLDPLNAQTAHGTSAPPQTSLSRSSWTPRVFSVPVDGTVHGPTYQRRVALADDTARQKTLFPTAESALDLGGDSRGTQAAEALLAPLSAAGQFVFMPLRLAITPPFRATQSPGPAQSYKRYPDGAWSSALPAPQSVPAAPNTRRPNPSGTPQATPSTPSDVTVQ